MIPKCANRKTSTIQQSFNIYHKVTNEAFPTRKQYIFDQVIKNSNTTNNEHDCNSDYEIPLPEYNSSSNFSIYQLNSKRSCSSQSITGNHFSKLSFSTIPQYYK